MIYMVRSLKVLIIRAVIMIFELLLPSMIVGCLVALSSGTLGCLVIWRRMAFFSDTLAHSAILGTAIAFIAEVEIIYGLLGFGLCVAFAMARFDDGKSHVSSDTFLAIISQSSLALGMLLLPLTGKSVNIEALLFGDILAINRVDVIVAGLITALIISLVSYNWQALLTLCIDEDLAASEGINIQHTKLLLFIMLVALVAIAVQMLGVLLISALLLIPAATARRLVSTPTGMLWLAPFIGIVSVLLGLASAYQFNLAVGPAIVVCTSAFWLCSQIKKSLP